MSVLIRDATVIPVEPRGRIFDRGAVYVEGAADPLAHAGGGCWQTPGYNARLMASRRFDWISSSCGDPARLATLQETMDRFYRRPEVREAYQRYIDKREAENFDHPFERQVAEYLTHLRPALALEIGCGNGRFFRTLRRAGFSGDYLGMEVAGWIVRDCKRRHPDASWMAASAYELPVASGSFDVCFSYGVVESFVHPEKALAEMLRVLKPGGRLVLLFPDFVESGRLGSQLTGLSPGRVGTKLQRRRWLDAAITFYDQRFRLPHALRASRKRIGPFPVNLAPVALDHPEVPLPDYDAVYVSSKADMEEWAAARGLPVEFPLGRRLPETLRARSWAFLVIRAR